MRNHVIGNHVSRGLTVVMIVMSKESENSAKGWKKLRKKKDLEVAKGYS